MISNRECHEMEDKKVCKDEHRKRPLDKIIFSSLHVSKLWLRDETHATQAGTRRDPMTKSYIGY